MLGLSETPVHRVNATSEKVNNKLLTHDVFHNGSEHTMGCTQEGYSKVCQYLINAGKPNTDILFNTF